MDELFDDAPKKPLTDDPEDFDQEMQDVPEDAPGMPTVQIIGGAALPPGVADAIVSAVRGIFVPGTPEEEEEESFTEEELVKLRAEVFEFLTPNWTDVKDRADALLFFDSHGSKLAKHDATCFDKTCDLNKGRGISVFTAERFLEFVRTMLRKVKEEDPALTVRADTLNAQWWVKLRTEVAADPRFEMMSCNYNRVNMLAHALKDKFKGELGI